MLHIGYFGPATASHDRTSIQSMFDVAVTPLRRDGPFDFVSSPWLEHLTDLGSPIGNDCRLAHRPLGRTVLWHHKISGIYLTAARLRAHVALLPMVEACCSHDAATG